ncbi:MAG: pyridoxal-phosphate dependent enzyme [Planctomycetes bacterium]|nr:pyridoxal-phosphate dependent enzyme [Planctomycetota bacterium]
MTSTAERRPELLAAVDRAAGRLEGRLRRTPLLWSPALGEALGFELGLKLENLQTTGSFKARPALNSVLAALERGPVPGFVTSSSGNFGIAAAWAARGVGLPLKLVMMPSASTHKTRVAEALGAEILRCADDYAAREERVRALIEKKGRLPLHPHDGEDSIAGDATLGLELAREVPETATIMVPASGAGLVAGVALGLDRAGHPARVQACQPAGNGSLARSLAEGRRLCSNRVRTIADGLSAAVPGKLGFELVREFGIGVTEVAEDSIRRALRLLVKEERLMVEPAAAVPLAALLEGRFRPAGPVILVLSGANIAPEDFAGLVRS